MSDNHDLLNDKDVCSFEEHEAENVCSNKDAVALRNSSAFGTKIGSLIGRVKKLLFFLHAHFAIFLCSNSDRVCANAFNREHACTIVFVTHDFYEAQKLADRTGIYRCSIDI